MARSIIPRNTRATLPWVACILSTLASGALFVGCKQTPAPPPPLETLLRIEWTGSAKCAEDTNASPAFRILSLPESVALKQQTLDKLSSAPWVLRECEVDTNASALLRPLLDDLIRHPCRFELAGRPDGAAAWLMAIRLDADQSRLWQSNLAIVIETLGNAVAMPRPDKQPGWIIEPQAWPGLVAFTRQDDWTLVGAANDLDSFEALGARLVGNSAAKDEGVRSNDWFGFTADLAALGRRFGMGTNLSQSLPVLVANVWGEEGRMRTEIAMNFEGPPAMALEPWDIPAGLIDQPCSSMTLCRGLPELFRPVGIWTKLGLDAPPSQLFVWAFQGGLNQTYFLMDVPDATNTVNRLTETVMNTQTNWLGTNAGEGFRRSESTDGFEWYGYPFMWPFLRTAPTNDPNLIVGGTFTWFDLVTPLDQSFFDPAINQGEVLYYDWERTDQRIEQWLFMTQFTRHVMDKPQLPFDSASLLWLKAIDSEMADIVTRVTLTASNQLTLTRTSDLGLTAVELQGLADWLESPTFPRGLHTFSPAPPASLPLGGETAGEDQ